jgi:hypothetical protein
MIGTTLERRHKFPIFGVASLIVAVACAGISFGTKNGNWAFFSILPAAIGAALLLVRNSEFRADVTSDGLYLSDSGENIPYANIRRVWHANAGLKSSTIFVFHQEGLVRIPRCEGTNNEELYAFLKSVVPAPEIPSVNPALRNFLQSQASTFGIDRVWVHNARPLAAEKHGRRSRAVILAAMATGFAWMVLGFSQKFDWGSAGLVLFIVSILAWLIWLTQNQNSPKQFRVKNWEASSLVISPAALALVQGDLTGELRWSEVRGLKFRNSTASRTRRVEVLVDGAQIQIRDLYDGPLTEIHRQIEHYWKAG